MSTSHVRRDSKGKIEPQTRDERFFAEDKYLKSYNQELKESITSFKISHPVPQENKLFYRFETNNNTSISSTTGQMEEAYLDIINSNEILRNKIKELRREIKELEEKINDTSKIYHLFHPSIAKLHQSLLEHLNLQKVENQRLMKEMSVILKENDETQKLIYFHLGKLHGLEKEVGVKARQLVYTFDSSIVDNEINNKFLIQDEDI